MMGMNKKQSMQVMWILKALLACYLVTGIFPLVPGADVYWTSYYIVTDDLALASETGFTAIKVAAAIVLGIIFVFEIPQGFFAVLAGRKKRT